MTYFSKRWLTTLERARDVSVLDLLDRMGRDTPKRSGKELKALCPLHEDKNPSMSITRDGMQWYCFACAEGGDAIQLYQRLHPHLRFRDVVDVMSKWY